MYCGGQLFMYQTLDSKLILKAWKFIAAKFRKINDNIISDLESILHKETQNLVRNWAVVNLMSGITSKSFGK